MPPPCGQPWGQPVQGFREAVHRQCNAGSPKKKGRPKAALCVLAEKPGADAYAVSPYTVTVISTTTSVCSCTDTVVSPTVLIGPLGRRTWDFATS